MAVNGVEAHRSKTLVDEQEHYDRGSPYLLQFLEQDQLPGGRWLIPRILATWDRQLALLDPSLIRGRRVLEIGCGNPRMLLYFKALGALRVIGCDLSRRFVDRGLAARVAYAHRAVLPVEPDQIELRFGDACGSATAGLELDAIACFQSLHHFPLGAFVATCRRLLVPGGHVIISDPVGNHPLRRLADVVGRRARVMSPGEQSHPPQEIVRAFARAGFAPQQVAALNPTLEVYFQLTELLFGRWARMALYSKAPMAVLRPWESFLEKTLLRVVPRLGWRVYLVFRKGEAACVS